MHVQRKRQTFAGRVAGRVAAVVTAIAASTVGAIAAVTTFTTVAATVAAAVATIAAAVIATVVAVIVVQVLHVVRIRVQFGLRFFLAQVRFIGAHLHRVPDGLVEEQVVDGIRPFDFGFHLHHLDGQVLGWCERRFYSWKFPAIV